ncbi:MAG: SpoVG family protein [Planctomycetales bacterium]|nr:SpoVG family protein [Planctomycetales bacterium]
MEITEVRIKLMEEPGERLKAFCSITFDNCFVVRDLKIIEGASGPFVAMPSRKLTAHCPRCGMKNHLRAPFCNQCGSQLSVDRTPVDADGRAKLYADIAHPINSACREMIQHRVIAEYDAELERAKEPGYVSRYDDFDFDYAESNRRSTSSGEARIDRAHGRPAPSSDGRPHSGGHDGAERTSPPPPKGGSAASQPRANEGFGAGIFGEE